MSDTRQAWKPWRAKTRTAASRIWRRLSCAACERAVEAISGSSRGVARGMARRRRRLARTQGGCNAGGIAPTEDAARRGSASAIPCDTSWEGALNRDPQPQAPVGQARQLAPDALLRAEIELGG